MATTATGSRDRSEIAERHKWNLDDIFQDWSTWETAYRTLEAGIDKYLALKGTLAQGPERLLEAFQLSDDLGQLAYRVWYYPSLKYDEDQRDNTVNAKRQQVQILFARLQQAQSWFNPELLKIPLDTVRSWMEASEPLRIYRFAIEDLYRQQEHVLDEAGERLMSLSTRLASSPNDAYWSLSTADAKFPTITLSTGEDVTVTYGQYRAILATRREQSDRENAFRALYQMYQSTVNTYATLYKDAGDLRILGIEARTHGRVLVRDAAAPAGALIGFHGYSETAEIQMARLESIPGAASWTLISVQALHRFYRGRSEEIAASWMTRQDRETAIEDNIEYINRVLAATRGSARPLVYTGFSQGVAMAFRAAVRGNTRADGIIAVAGDVPPELLKDPSSAFPRVLLARGERDDWYNTAKLQADVAALTARGGQPETLVYDGGHEWSPEISVAAGVFLARCCTR